MDIAELGPKLMDTPKIGICDLHVEQFSETYLAEILGIRKKTP